MSITSKSLKLFVFQADGTLAPAPDSEPYPQVQLVQAAEQHRREGNVEASAWRTADLQMPGEWIFASWPMPKREIGLVCVRDGEERSGAFVVPVVSPQEAAALRDFLASRKEHHASLTINDERSKAMRAAKVVAKRHIADLKKAGKEVSTAYDFACLWRSQRDYNSSCHRYGDTWFSERFADWGIDTVCAEQPDATWTEATFGAAVHGVTRRAANTAWAKFSGQPVPGTEVPAPFGDPTCGATACQVPAISLHDEASALQRDAIGWFTTYEDLAKRFAAHKVRVVAAGHKWSTWYQEHFPELSRQRVSQLLAVGRADDPVAEAAAQHGRKMSTVVDNSGPRRIDVKSPAIVEHLPLAIPVYELEAKIRPLVLELIAEGKKGQVSIIPSYVVKHAEKIEEHLDLWAGRQSKIARRRARGEAALAKREAERQAKIDEEVAI
ncbi:MAG: hypothetical protein JO310_18275 [Hyphomicrobiales bacterium]|nr:hypothetical protein [Hyphomicrobiales bacterium]